MSVTSSRLLSAPALAFIVSVPGVGWQTAGATDHQEIAGIWRGTSTCVEKGTACNDEVAVYRISAVAGKMDVFIVDGGRVVDGQEVSMGPLEGRFDAKAHTLTMTPPQGSIVLTLSGDTLNGTYTRSNKQVLRQIRLKKSAARPV